MAPSLQTIQYGIWFFPRSRFYGLGYHHYNNDDYNGEHELVHMWGLGIQQPRRRG